MIVYIIFNFADFFVLRLKNRVWRSKNCISNNFSYKPNTVYIDFFSFSIQWCTTQQQYCFQALKSKTAVERCPSSKDEWDRAAQKKNCENIVYRQTCTPPDNFKYHCVINAYRNETVEVCAPARIILGYCLLQYIRC